MKIEKETIEAIKTNWSLVKEELNKELYNKFEKLIIRKVYDTMYMMNFDIRIYSNVTRENYYDIHFIKYSDFDFKIDFKPENIDKSLDKMTELLESSDYFEKFMGKVILELFYIVQYATDAVLNPVYIYLTDDGDGWEPEWTHYISGTTHQYLISEYKDCNCRYAYNSLETKTPLQIYDDLYTFSSYRKLYGCETYNGLYVLLEESIDVIENEDEENDTFWNGEIIDVKTKLTPGMEGFDYKYLSIDDIKNRECHVDCGYSVWASKYDDPMDI